MGNLENIAKTLAMHHQKYMCYQLFQSERSSFLNSPPSVDPGKASVIIMLLIAHSPSIQLSQSVT